MPLQTQSCKKNGSRSFGVNFFTPKQTELPRPKPFDVWVNCIYENSTPKTCENLRPKQTADLLYGSPDVRETSSWQGGCSMLISSRRATIIFLQLDRIIHLSLFPNLVQCLEYFTIREKLCITGVRHESSPIDFPSR